MYKQYTTIIILFLTSTLFANASISKTQYAEITSLVKSQTYLTEQISQNYKSFQSDRQNTEKKTKLQTSMKLFTENHKKLLKNKYNTKAINDKLLKVSTFWDDFNKLMKEQEKISSSFGDTHMIRIKKKMNELTKLYEANYR